MTEPRTIYFVDSDDETRGKLSEVARLMQVHLESFSDGSSFLKAFADRPGCLVTELLIEDMSGLDLQQRIAKSGSKLPVIFVTAHSEIHLIVRAMQNGAATVLQKPASKKEIWDAITQALSHDREIRRVDAQHDKLTRQLTRLTSKEKDVLDLVIAGLPNKVIAKRLDVSVRTVEARRQKIFHKTKSNSLSDLIRLVILAESKPSD